MTIFALYQIILSRSRMLNLFRDIDGEKIKVEGNEQLFFGELFKYGCGISMYSQRKDGTPQNYHNKVVVKRNDVIILQFCNEKYVTIVQDYNARKEPSNPWCYVIIDNRPGKCLLAIQKSASFDGEPDKVRNILQENLNRHLSDIGIDVEIKNVFDKEVLWDVIERRCVQQNDIINRLALDFNNNDLKNKATLAGPKSAQELAIHTLAVAKAIKATNSLIQFISQNGGIEMKRSANHDSVIECLVDLCCSNGFDVVVYFKNHGEYHLQKDNKAMMQLGDVELLEFISGEPRIGYTPQECYPLIQWLDDMSLKV